MLKRQKLSELTLDELHKQKQVLSGALVVIAVVMGVLIGVTIYLLISGQKFSILTVIPVILLPTFLPVAILFRKTRQEISMRS